VEFDVIAHKLRHYPPGRWFQLAHADKDGSPVLRTEASWRTVNGFVLGRRMS
jgi:hypothetical protein